MKRKSSKWRIPRNPKKKEEWDKLKRTCKLCCRALLFYGQRGNTFCDSRCMRVYLGNNGDRARMVKRCSTCNVLIPKHRKFCANGCSTRMRPFEKLTTDDSRRRFLIRETGFKCEICLLTEWRGAPLPVELDHINGDSSNNERSNLRLICSNCHAQTPTFRGRNIGRGTRYWLKKQRLAAKVA